MLKIKIDGAFRIFSPNRNIEEDHHVQACNHSWKQFRLKFTRYCLHNPGVPFICDAYMKQLKLFFSLRKYLKVTDNYVNYTLSNNRKLTYW